MTCPRCKSDNISRSKRPKPFDAVMRIFDLRPFRCHDCSKRFYLPGLVAEVIDRQRAWRKSVRYSAENLSRA